MNASAIISRIDVLVQRGRDEQSLALQNELYQGTLTILGIVYGPQSSHEKELKATIEGLREKAPAYNQVIVAHTIDTLLGALANVRADITGGLIGSVRAQVTSDVLTDFVQLARSALDTPGDDAKNVGAVLVAAAFEDAIRRLAELKGIPHEEKLGDVLTRLKASGHLQGAQVGVAQSYLSFRNKALHAQWSEVDRTVVQSALAFVEQLLVSAF